MFTENGPLHIDPGSRDWKVNPWSWNTNFNLVFLDQPVGTGLSVVKKSEDYATTEEQVAEMFYQWKNGFLNKYPEFKGRSLYITGESYAGEYIPFMANRLLTGMKDLGNQDPTFELKGVSMGNPWVDPSIQNPAYLSFSLYSNIITLEDYFKLEPAFEACGTLMKYGESTAQNACEVLLTAIIRDSHGQLRFNWYDYTKPCPPGLALCYDFDYLDKFFASKSVKAVEGFSASKTWSDCSNTVYTKLKKRDWKVSSIPQVSDLLEAGVKVLVYAGDKDFICNWVGQENWTNAVKWSGKDGFNSALVKSEHYGDKKCSGNFAFVKVPNAGHMVPLDQPELAFSMITDFEDGAMFGNCE